MALDSDDEVLELLVELKDDDLVEFCDELTLERELELELVA